MAKKPKKEKPFATEAALCARFIEALPIGWTPYAETAGWDILLVRATDGFQIGVQAKLRLNADVVLQTIEETVLCIERRGPDCRAVLVPNDDCGPFDRIADHIGFTIIRVSATRIGVIRDAFSPKLPGDRWTNGHWHELCPVKRCELPAYVPDVAAGAKSPLQLTDWKIEAIKLAIVLERRGFVTREDFKHRGIDHRRWIAPGNDWLAVVDGRFVRGPNLPDFKAQHPKVYSQIEADSHKWFKDQPNGALLI